MGEENSETGSGVKLRVTLLLILVLLIGAAYAGGIVFFQDHFLPGTRINEFHCDFMTVPEAERLLNREVQAYELELHTKNNGVEGIKASDVGLQFQPGGEIKRLLESQDRWTWFLSLGKTLEYTTAKDVIYDEAKLSLAVQGLQCMQGEHLVEPQDASIQKIDGEYQIVKEVVGNTPDYPKLLSAVAEAMTSGEKVLDLEASGCYMEPQWTAEDPIMQENLKFVQKFNRLIITYDFADQTEVVDEDRVLGWLMTNEDGSYALDPELVSAFVGQLSTKYDTVGKDKTFRRYDGTVITVSGGDYGWQIDREQETQALMQAILDGKTEVREPIYSQSAFSRDTTDDIGHTYIEINLSAQKLVWYVEGQPMIETNIVSGMPGNDDTMTPLGVYSLKDKQTSYSDVREQVVVNWWLGFTESCGIHDAPWRSSFALGENVNSGTAGCVDVPTAEMQTLFGGAELGTPVVIYQ